MRALVVCPGRGSFQKAQLGSLKGGHPVVAELDAFRESLGRPTLSELDGADRFSGVRHVAGENASILTFGATARDLALIDHKKMQVVAVAGNSMGFYTALHAAGCLSLLDAAHLVETMGAMQKDNVIGGQLLYPVVNGDWTIDAERAAAVEAVLAHEEVFLSIRLGGTAVIGGSTEGLRNCMKQLPKVKQGAREFPIQLPMHSAFHTPLLAATSATASEVLADLPLKAPTVPLIAGDGRIFGRWASPTEILDYTLGKQVVDCYDFSLSIKVALGDFAPEVVVLPGPGDTLGGPVAQTMIQLGWRGLRDKQDFLDAQAADQPLLLSMTWPKQRRMVVA
jgi:malonyl CoA-acyl carrier protein transacylase